ncbi:cell envelope integrity protein TolA [Pelomonas cellulosilytica]|uniref:Cell envelope integrity protein TolA n=1 Tax=Pelomonas cellulosilytica TaxID=2906762 RepID=A0ABS8XYN6_9BURK|nr:cell envelope integrity protein TolA [Pelomonas sp. P8]MCE4555854.1 cell envelope integrity protein TolA [Pelomonas sp. P8]
MNTAVLRPPEAAGIGRGLALALLAHGLLILALTYGLHWRSDSSPAFEAELWASVPQVAAPREEAPPEPEPAPAKPEPQAQQRAAEEEAAQQREAEIAIAKEKKRKEEKAREDALKLEREKAEKAEKAAKEKEAKAAKDKAAKEEQDRKKAQDAKDAKAAKEADAKREALRLENLRRIQGMAGGTPGSTGTAAQNAAPSAGWVGKVKGKIRPLIIYADDGGANPTAEVQVALAPDGRILGSKVLKASGDAEWDRAVLRAIEKAETLPRDTDGRVPPVLILNLRPRE